MRKDNILGVRFDDDTLEFVKEQSKKANETMSEWIRNGIKEKRSKK